MSVACVSPSALSPAEIAQLQKQILQLQKELQTEQSSKDDAKTKAQKETLYEQQIVELQQEIQQAQQQAALKAAQTGAGGDANAEPAGVGASDRKRRSSDSSRYLDTQA